MKQNTKFLWIYIAILFSFALILILFAGLTQNNYQKEIKQQQSESVGIKQNLVTLTDENQKLKDSVKKIKSENTELKAENDKLVYEKGLIVASLGDNTEISQKIFDAYIEFLSGNTENAKELIKTMEKSSLTNNQLTIYNTIIGE